MSSFRVLLDACVLVPSAVRDTLLRAAEAELFQLYWSEDILDEVERNVAKLTLPDKATSLVNQMREYFPEAMVMGYRDLVQAMLNDHKDRHVLAAAVKCGAQTIVTQNLRDFPIHALAPYGIEAQSPDEFLVYQYDLDPERLVAIVEAQAADLSDPPESVDYVLAKIELDAPIFASKVRDYRQRRDQREPHEAMIRLARRPEYKS